MGCSKVDNEITDFYTRIYHALDFLHIRKTFYVLHTLTL